MPRELVWKDQPHQGRVPAEKPTSEQLRLEAERLRTTAIKVMEHAATLIEKSAELEKRISESLENGNNSKKTSPSP